MVVARTPVLRWASILALAMSLSSCVTVGLGPAPDRPVAPVTGDNAITIGSFNFPESVVLAELYGQALEANGFVVHRALDLGPRELVEPALERGLIEFVPEYLGTALAFLEDSSGRATGGTEVTRETFTEAFRGRGIDVLDPSEAQDANALAVTATTAARYDLREISDLGPVSRELVLGGPPECPSRPLCLLGLQSRYGLHFKRFVPLDSGGPLTVEELAAGQIDVAVLFSTDGDIQSRGFVLLEDDRGLQPPENVTPVVRMEIVARYGQRFTDVVNAVSAKLTTEGLRELNRLVSLGSTSPARVAHSWLQSNHVLPG